ncbi:MAG: DUF4440 domain-containing protein [Acetobacteraceae bacterium]|nr:DUF4440 domain-containing protein [Acetobacteraceae bacterium]MBV8525262.1 DUF4440 domain-containing protein [Acetobacteraceae bacterium]MBV8589357.1 DUF4440 domain-containing protein [Acetobacteraceae bacterium]
MASRPVASIGKVVIGVVTMASGAMTVGAAQQPFPPAIDYNQPGNRKPTEMDKFKILATEVNGRRSECYKRKDAACAAAVFTDDATFIEVQPDFKMLKGRAQIQRHYQELITANATDLTPTVTTVSVTGKDTGFVGGDYTIVAKGKRIDGHFFQTIKQVAGKWEIASHFFARGEPITASEDSTYRGN